MPKKAKKEKRPVAKIDFKPYGAAIKAGRTKQKESRNKAADALFISPRYLANIENKGQHPSVQVFLELMSRYHISVDQILYGEEATGKSTERMQFDILMDELTDAEIKILTTTAQALLDARTDSEGENWIRCKERYEQVVHGVFPLKKFAYGLPNCGCIIVVVVKEIP